MAGVMGLVKGNMGDAIKSKMSDMINNTGATGENVAAMSGMMQPQEQSMMMQAPEQQPIVQQQPQVSSFQAQNSALQQSLQQQNALANSNVMNQLQQPQERPWWMQYDGMM